MTTCVKEVIFIFTYVAQFVTELTVTEVTVVLFFASFCYKLSYYLP